MKRNLKQILIALEEQATGKASFEREYVFYAKLDDFSILKDATHSEFQEQWNLKIDKSADNYCFGRIRIRKTVANGETTYVQTIKTPVSSSSNVSDEGNIAVPDASQNMFEVAINASEDAFAQFKLIADQGMIKTRYVFPIKDTDLKFEVDVFHLPDGKLSEWVKIDLEVNSPLEEIPALPLGFSQAIMNQKDNQTDEEKQFILKLYDEVFLTKNMHIEK